MQFPTRRIEFALVSGKREPYLEDDGSDALKLVGQVIDGAFDKVLQSPFARALFVHPESLDVVTQKGTEALLDLSGHCMPSTPETEISLLVIGIASLHYFLQENWTGPDLQLEPCDLFFSSSSEKSLECDIPSSLNRLALSELACGGEPAYHLAKRAVLLRISQIIFHRNFLHLVTLPWWILRVTKTHLQILDEPVTPPQSVFDALEGLISELHGEDDLRGTLILEHGLMHHVLGNDREAAMFFVRAAKALGLRFELTGKLGKRTKFQQADLSQLVILAQGRPRSGKDSINSKDAVTSAIPAAFPLNDDTLLEHTEFTSSQDKPDHSAGPLAHIDPLNQPSLHPLEQSILLAMSLNVRNTQPQHGLTTEQMLPYVERVLSQPRNWSVHTMALFLRSRLESTRTRTIERSTLQLQALIDQMPTSDSTTSERLMYIHSIPLPSKWQLEGELAIRYLSLGVTRSAMEIFEQLEMWEEVVKCWQSMERPEKGIRVVRDLLEGYKEESETVLARGKSTLKPKRAAMDAAREAKFWCLLGDLEPNSCYSHYTHAWEVSQRKSGRAARSLGGYHFARSELPSSIGWLKKAVAINPLVFRAWFILGCACLREEEWLDARDAFARCVTIDEDDGESWSNLASVYLRMGATSQRIHTKVGGSDGVHIDEPFPEMSLRKSDRIPFDNKVLAFRALKQGLKFSWDNWRMWQNYMIVCVDVGELAEATRALGRIVEECGEKQGERAVDLDVLGRLVDAVIRSGLNGEDKQTADGPMATHNPNEGKALLPRVLDLFTRVILPRISSPRVFRAYARLLMYQNRWGDALEAHMNAYRCGTGADEFITTDIGRWREAVPEVEELVDVMRNLGPRVGSQDDETTSESDGKRINWRFQARSVVRGFMGRTRDSFEGEPEWQRLQSLLDELKN